MLKPGFTSSHTSNVLTYSSLTTQLAIFLPPPTYLNQDMWVLELIQPAVRDSEQGNKKLDRLTYSQDKTQNATH